MLVPVDPTGEQHQQLLYKLLEERYLQAETINTLGSLPTLPSFSAYRTWLTAQPCDRYYLCSENGVFRGSVLLRPWGDDAQGRCEIGVFVFARHRGEGVGTRAVEAILNRHPQTSPVAIINPHNQASESLFRKFGFRPAETVWVRE